MVEERANIYWGLVVSNMGKIVIIWKFVILGTFRNFTSKINVAVYYNLLIAMVFVVVASFVSILKASKKVSKKNYIRRAVRSWWVCYENFVYPSLVLVQNPLYFFVIIGLSQLFFL